MVVTFQIVGHKKSGKTTLTNDFLKIAPQLNYQISVVKHTHGPVDIPNNTDTGKFYERSNDVLLLNDSQTIHYQRGLNRTAEEQIRQMQQTTPADFLIIEGLKELDYPKIVLLKEDETPNDFGEATNILHFVSIQQTTTSKEIVSLLDPDIKRDFITKFLRELL
ncbi:molybdopterin-guanine dinucleotide biosynthesis protein B [Companilactobacillus furfuricola]|uniref:molybdopterin-guanine dinucleotide biosynthesis protein B n=1 Tax=Companilactobacillus furfuricola TaxID=1462575 RepID=UPI000F7B3CE7|nr:molybdopterin-guanine dinucleotide biosynthesis protein B [Companilactobacillus furfuricola]